MPVGLKQASRRRRHWRQGQKQAGVTQHRKKRKSIPGRGTAYAETPSFLLLRKASSPSLLPVKGLRGACSQAPIPPVKWGALLVPASPG